MMPRKEIKAGTRFGHLVVIGVGEPMLRSDSGKRSTSIVKCNLCGKEKVVANSELLKGRHKTCGCIPSNKKHGCRYTKLYRTWCSMKYRCSGKSRSTRDKSYVGIHVCDEWANDFLVFKEWALSHGYSDDLSIDRIDSTGNYEPSNCRWIPMCQQSGNRRTNSKVSAFGQTMTYAEWSKLTGISAKLIRQRIVRQGMSPEMALKKQ